MIDKKERDREKKRVKNDVRKKVEDMITQKQYIKLHKIEGRQKKQ